MTEDVREGHADVLGVMGRGGKGGIAVLSALWLVGACAAPAPLPPPRIEAPPTPTAEPPPVVLPPTPQEEAKKLLGMAATTTDPHERCKLLAEAATLDPSPETRLPRAESRCAPATALLDDARAVFAAHKTVRAATVLATVATRAEAKVDALVAAEALLGHADVAALGLAGRTFGRFDAPARAVVAYDALAKLRADKGAAADALDATLEAAMWAARAKAEGAKARLVAALEAAKAVASGYGAAWVRPRFVEAIAVLRHHVGADAGKQVDALADKALGLVAEPGHVVERAIADARAGKPELARALAKKARAETLASPEVRALLSVVARVGGQCGVARAHARAHATLAEGPLVLRDDVAWAATCEGGADEATLTAPAPSAVVDDATALAAADPLRARSILETWVGAHPSDVAGRLALAAVVPAGARAAVLNGPDLAREPAVVLALIEATTGAARADAAKLFSGVARTTVEAAVDPRAVAPALARALAWVGPEDGWLDVAEALVTTCAAPRKTKACADPTTLAVATARLRGTRPAALCKAGVLLADADLAGPRVRLDVVLACTSKKLLVPALSVSDVGRGPFAAPESALAHAALAALQKKCPAARAHLAQTAALAQAYAAEIQAIGAACPG